MNTTTQSEALALARGDQKRLEQLAALAGRSPQSMLKFVLRDGFEGTSTNPNLRQAIAGKRESERMKESFS